MGNHKYAGYEPTSAYSKHNVTLSHRATLPINFRGERTRTNTADHLQLSRQPFFTERSPLSPATDEVSALCFHSKHKVI